MEPVTREIELWGGPADGTVIAVPRDQYNWYVPVAPDPSEWFRYFSAETTSPVLPVKHRVAVYAPIRLTDRYWRFSGWETR